MCFFLPAPQKKAVPQNTTMIIMKNHFNKWSQNLNWFKKELKSERWPPINFILMNFRFGIFIACVSALFIISFIIEGSALVVLCHISYEHCWTFREREREKKRVDPPTDQTDEKMHEKTLQRQQVILPMLVTVMRICAGFGKFRCTHSPFECRFSVKACTLPCELVDWLAGWLVIGAHQMVMNRSAHPQLCLHLNCLFDTMLLSLSQRSANYLRLRRSLSAPYHQRDFFVALLFNKFYCGCC